MTNVPSNIAVVARGLTERGPSGPVYGPVDLDIPAGGLTILTAPSGSGRTCLLLTLAGRMKPKSGTLEVFGATTPKGVFARAAVGAVDDLDAVYDSVRVIDVVTEKLRWDAPWFRFIGRRAEAVDEVCRQVFGPLPTPDPQAYVEDLTELEVALLRVALASTRRPPLLVVGGVDRLSSIADERRLLQRLVDVGREQTVVTATGNPVDADLGHRLVIDVPNLAQNDLVHDEGTN